MWDLAFVGRDIGGTTVWGQRVRVVVVVVVGVVCAVQFNTVDAITVDAILLLPFDAMWTILFTHNIFCSTTSAIVFCQLDLHVGNGHQRTTRVGFRRQRSHGQPHRPRHVYDTTNDH